MRFNPKRLRSGEVIAGVAALVLLLSMLLMSWYGLRGRTGPPGSRIAVTLDESGWNGLSHVRWLLLVSVAAALGLLVLQATRRAPALPAAFSVIVTVLATLSALALIYRVLISAPGSRLLGAFVGLVSGVALLYGGYRSLREEGIAEGDAPTDIPVVELDGDTASAGG
jgi:hypothetical protein